MLVVKTTQKNESGKRRKKIPLNTEIKLYDSDERIDVEQDAIAAVTLV